MQANTLTDTQISLALSYLETTRYAKRDQVILLLSVKAGLKANEIAGLSWEMITDAEGQIGNAICFPDKVIPLNTQLKEALVYLLEEVTSLHYMEDTDPVIYSERGGSMSANSIVMWFNQLFKKLGFDGCSSHSGRRTFIANGLQKASLVGATLKDVQKMAGHSFSQTTRQYMGKGSMQDLVDLL